MHAVSKTSRRSAVGAWPSVALVACLATASTMTACTNVQDLGASPAPATSALPAPAAPSSSAAIPAPAPTSAEVLGACPSGAPVEGEGCSVDVGFCHYRVDPAHGLAATCACGVDRRWTCLVVRDDDRRNPLAPSTMPLSNASCTEGAPCVEGVRCAVGGVGARTCGCTSAGILLCTRPAL